MTATSIAAGLAALLGSAYLVDYELGIRHDLKYAKAGEKTLKYLLEREAEGKASVVEPFITTARGPDADREFLVFEDYSASFRGADIETNRLAQLLVSKGVKPGDVVAICFENSPQAVYAQLAVWKCGAAVGFLNHNLRGNNLLHTFKLGKGKHLLFEDRNMEAVESIAGDLDKGTVLMCYGFSMPKESQIPSAIRALDFVAFDAGRLEKEFPDGKLDVGLEVRKSIRLNSFSGIYYTSGTTGLPKAAYQIHNRLRTFPTAVNIGLDYLGRNDRILCDLPLYHGAAQVSLNVCCMSGGTYIFRRKFSASTFWKEAIRTGATAMQHIGESARYIFAVPPSPLDKEHNVTKGIGVGLRPDMWKPFMDRFHIKQMFEWYGASEGVVGLFHIQSGTDGIGTVGRLGYLARKRGNIKFVKVDLDTEQIIRDKETGFAKECGWGESGEVIGRIDPPEVSPVKATNFDGYFGDKAATEKKIARDVFVKGDAWMRMGDLLSIDRRGFVRFHDRVGDTFRWNGENVATSEVAQELASSDEITEINVYGVLVPGRDGRAGMAAVRLREGVDPSPDNLKKVMERFGKLAASKLPSYAVPRFVRVMPEIEITGTFKHRKVDLMRQGFDPRSISDPLFVFNSQKRTYEPLGVAEFNNVVAGKARL